MSHSETNHQVVDDRQREVVGGSTHEGKGDAERRGRIHARTFDATRSLRTDRVSRSLQRDLAHTQRQLSQAATLVEILSGIARGQTLRESAQAIAVALSRATAAARVMIAREDRGRLEMLAVSDVAHWDPGSERMQRDLGVVEESLRCKRMVVFPDASAATVFPGDGGRGGNEPTASPGSPVSPDGTSIGHDLEHVQAVIDRVLRDESGESGESGESDPGETADHDAIDPDRDRKLGQSEMPAHVEMAARHGGLISVPLIDANEPNRTRPWATLIACFADPVLVTTAAPFLDAASEPLSAALKAKDRPAWHRKTMQNLGRTPRVRHALIAAIAIGLIGFLPVSHPIPCEATVQPLVRRFAVVPHNGILNDTFVRPGDLVRRGETLAAMDIRESSLELASKTSARHQAKKALDAAMADHEVSDMVETQWRLRQLEAECQAIRDRMERSEIRSPINGRILSGDAERRQNVAVRRGETLFEIASAGGYRLRLAIPADDIGWIREGMTASFLPEDSAESVQQVSISRIGPRAQVIDGQNVFLAWCEPGEANRGLDSESLRAGMRGRARVYADTRSLAFVLLHKAKRLGGWAVTW